MPEFVQIISQVGFPIAVCVYLLFDSAKQRDQHRQEMDEMTKAVMNNTAAIEKLAERMSTKNDI